MKEKVTECNICKKKYLLHAISKHIAQMAAKEAQYKMCMLINTSKMKPRTFSPIVLMNNCPHWKLYRKINPRISKRPINSL